MKNTKIFKLFQQNRMIYAGRLFARLQEMRCLKCDNGNLIDNLMKKRVECNQSCCNFSIPNKEISESMANLKNISEHLIGKNSFRGRKKKRDKKIKYVLKQYVNRVIQRDVEKQNKTRLNSNPMQQNG